MNSLISKDIAGPRAAQYNKAANNPLNSGAPLHAGPASQRATLAGLKGTEDVPHDPRDIYTPSNESGSHSEEQGLLKKFKTALGF
jgi:hypothetical protein